MTSPNTIETTGIIIDVPTATDPGPGAQALVTNGLVTICAHTHDGIEDGNLINIAGQEISGDLSLDGYNLSNVRSVQFLSQPSVLSGSQDVNSVYVNQNNLGFNNSNGIFVPITDGNSLAVTSLPFTNFSIRTVSSNFTILNTDTYNVIDINTSGGPITGTLPICATIAPQAAGRLFLFRDVSGNAGANNVTIQVAVASGNTFADGAQTTFPLNTNGGYVAIYTDGVSKWFTWSQNTFSFEFISYNVSVIEMNETIVNMDADSIFSSLGSVEVSDGTLTLFDSNMNIQGSNVEYSAGSHEYFDTGTNIEHRSGSVDTYDAGSDLVLNGSLNGTTTGGTLNIASVLDLTGTVNMSGTENMTGALNLSGTTTQTGTLNLDNNNNFLNGQLNVNGAGVINLNATQIIGDKNSIIGTLGALNMFGQYQIITQLNAGTYNVDSGGGYDNVLGIILTQTGAWVINFPSAPSNGRVIVVQDIAGISQSSPNSWSITINASHPFSNNTLSVNGGGSGAGGTTASPFVYNNSGLTASPWFTLNFMYANGVWISPNANSYGG